MVIHRENKRHIRQIIQKAASLPSPKQDITTRRSFQSTPSIEHHNTTRSTQKNSWFGSLLPSSSSSPPFLARLFSSQNFYFFCYSSFQRPLSGAPMAAIAGSNVVACKSAGISKISGASGDRRALHFQKSFPISVGRPSADHRQHCIGLKSKSSLASSGN